MLSIASFFVGDSESCFSMRIVARRFIYKDSFSKLSIGESIAQKTVLST